MDLLVYLKVCCTFKLSTQLLLFSQSCLNYPATMAPGAEICGRAIDGHVYGSTWQHKVYLFMQFEWTCYNSRRLTCGEGLHVSVSDQYNLICLRPSGSHGAASIREVKSPMCRVKEHDAFTFNVGVRGYCHSLGIEIWSFASHFHLANDNLTTNI